jgi:hypothetical protein
LIFIYLYNYINFGTNLVTVRIFKGQEQQNIYMRECLQTMAAVGMFFPFISYILFKLITF